MSSDIASGVIHRLKEVMAELEKDKARLDWLNRNMVWYKPSQHGDIREQIDAAIEAKRDSEEWEARDYRARMEGMSRG